MVKTYTYLTDNNIDYFYSGVRFLNKINNMRKWTNPAKLKYRISVHQKIL